MKSLEESILEFCNSADYRPAKPRVIAEKIGRKDEAVMVRRAVKLLVRRGLVRYASNHLVLPNKAKPSIEETSRRPTAGGEAAEVVDETTRRKSTRKPVPKTGGNRVLGVFQRTQKGFGFVRVDQPGVPREKAKDIYVSAEESADAATGDVVLVELTSKRRGELGPRGRIVQVVERQTHQFVGTYFESQGAAYVKVDGAMFARPIGVGDPGAKNAQPDDKVVVEMLRFPSPLHDGEGVITEVLGQRGKPGVDTLSIIREFGLPDQFAADAVEEANERADAFDESIGSRKDFTGETIVTIDPVDARDFDDAISLDRLDNGHWRLGVHIADVSHFVRPDTPLDREAVERATSVYLPDRVLPMLPEVISNGLASLQPGKVRYTKSAVMEFTDEGLRVSTELYSAAIRSNKRLTYEQVDEFLAAFTGARASRPPEAEHAKGTDVEGRDVPLLRRSSAGDRSSTACEQAVAHDSIRKKLGGKVFDLLGRMHALAMTLRKRRMTNGALELNMPEVKVDLDKQGRVTGAHVVENTESHQIIEEFMLAANEAVAEAIRDRGLHFLRRVHQSPSPQKLQALTEFVAELGYKTESLQSRFELQKLLAAATGKPEQHAVHFAVLRSMQRAIYSPMEEGHYALASECYCHFTSPIRRYPDLTVHRLINAMLTSGKGVRPLLPERPEGCLAQKGSDPFSARPKIRQNYDELVVLARHCSDREQRAEAAERDLTKLKLLAYLSERIGEEMEALVTGVESYGLFVQGVKLPAEGLIRVETLRDDRYHFDRASHTLSGHRAGNAYRLGDLLKVAVARVDLERREIDFRVVEKEKGRPALSEKSPEGAKKGLKEKKDGIHKKRGKRT